MTVARLIGRIFSRFGNPERFIPGEDATARVIRRLASPCPACGRENLDGHKYAEVASQRALENNEELKQFCGLYISRKWGELNQIHEFGGTINNLVIYALFCNQGGSMLAIRSPFELWEADSLEDAIPFDEQEAEVIRSLPIRLLDVSKADQNGKENDGRTGSA